MQRTFVSRSQPLRAVKPIPQFKPVPFKQEKFLSMKSRTAGTYFNARQRILKRSTAVLEQQQQQQTECTPNDGLASSKNNSNNNNSNNISLNKERVLVGRPITSHMAEEIDVWNRNLKNIEALQGFVLTDELIYDAISKNIHLGAFPYVLDWLRKAAEEERVPIPLFIISDLRAFIDFIQSMLPASNASLNISPETFLGSNAVGNYLFKEEKEETASEGVPLRLVNPSPYVRYLLKEMYIPVWECLQQLGLLPSSTTITRTIIEEEESSETDWNCLLQAYVCKDKVSNILQHICSSSSVAASAISIHSNNDRDAEVPTVLQAFLDLFLALAQCAAEAKEVYILRQLQFFFCTLFVKQIHDSGDSNLSLSKLREEVWCRSDADIESLRRFSNDFLSAVYYGRYAYRNEFILGHSVGFTPEKNSLHDGNNNGNNNTERNNNNNNDNNTNTTWEENRGSEEEEGESGVDGSASLSSFEEPQEGRREEVEQYQGKEEKKEEQQQVSGNDKSVNSSLPKITLQDAVDNVLKDLLRNESLALFDASLYAALALQDVSLIPNSDSTVYASALSVSPSRFSHVEMEWMRIYCDLCHRYSLNENITDTLESLFRPNGVVVKSIEISRNDNDSVGQECFMALVVDLIITVGTMPSMRKVEQQRMILRCIDEFLSRLKELEKKQQESSSLLLPIYSATSLLLLITPYLTRNNPLKGNENNIQNKKKEKEEEDMHSSDCETSMRILRSLMVSVMEQPTGFGNAYGAVFMVLVRTELWDEVLQLLHKLDTVIEEEVRSDQQGISSVLMDQRVWAWMFRKARDAGRVDICLFLRRTREKLFY
ncbi:hypothetical protein LSM04_003151 [Trypanosoma melophagium]|uniref:uncharacterized protein n=1 Tax=Trypanosoma melophagium TaxID=715481 RepID=UPI00351A9873|nr:hypothetical protein LSM04_003151 [Trypanosoma melophagium]